MAFVLPTFNLTVAICSPPWVGHVVRVVSVANYAFGRRVQQFAQDIDPANASGGSFQSTLLLPPLTDVRSYAFAGQDDLVEIPQGSGRWYGVVAVDDIGKGFANEHRAAQVTIISQFVDAIAYPGLLWPVPMT